ncbi:MAG: PIN domain-containing protein [Nanoarchaeota archaeon]
MAKIVKIILDTNFLMMVGQFNVDIFEKIKEYMQFNYELYVCSGIIDELKKITKIGNRNDKTAAKIALELIKSKNINIILKDEENKNNFVDDLLVNLSKNEDYFIATQDVELKKRLKKIIYLRQKKYIQVRGLMD